MTWRHVNYTILIFGSTTSLYFSFLMLYCLFKIWLLSRATLVTFEGCNVADMTKVPLRTRDWETFFCCMLSPNCAMDSDKLQLCVGWFCWVQRFEALTETASLYQHWWRVLCDLDKEKEIRFTLPVQHNPNVLRAQCICPAWTLQMNKWQIRAKLFEEKNKSTLN